MASTLLDLVIMTPSSAFGTSGTIPLGSAAAVNGVTYLSFSGVGATGGSQVSYSLLDPVNGGSEIGTATYTSSNNTLTSRTPTKSTTGSSFINASSGTLILASLRGEDLNSFIVAGQLLGTGTNDNASTGNVGEYLTSTVSSGSGVAFTSAGNVNITTLPLGAGDWDVGGIVGFFPSSNVSTIVVWTSSQSATVPADVIGQGAVTVLQATFTSGARQTVPVGDRRYSVASSTTAYLSAQITGSSGIAYGFMWARRPR